MVFPMVYLIFLVDNGVTRNTATFWSYDEKSWKIKIHKIDPLLMAVFQPAIYELKYGPKISKKVVISEYLSIANKFFSEREIGLLNGVLDNIK